MANMVASMPQQLTRLPCSLPTAAIPEFLDLDSLANSFAQTLEVLSEDDFVQDALWRDIFVMTGTTRTFYSARSVVAAWKATSNTHRPTSFTIDGKAQVIRAGLTAWVEVGFTFGTQGVPATIGHGYVSVVPDATGKWKIWILRTILEQLVDQPDVDYLEPIAESCATESLADGVVKAEEEPRELPLGIGVNGDAAYGAVASPPDADGHDTNGVGASVNGTTQDGTAPNGSTFSDHTSHGTVTNGSSSNDHISNGTVTNGVSADSAATNTTKQDSTRNVDYDCVVIGGGQAGLAVGGRLKALGVSYLIVEKHAEVGDSWKTRYDSMRLHTVREFAHLPFERTFPSTYQEWLTKYDLAEGYQNWAKKYDINVSTSTSVVSGSWISEEDIWALKLLRKGEELDLKCSYVVFAAGGGAQFPVSPTYEDKHVFRGVTVHSGHYKSSAEWSGKHGVVVGTGNTGHDIAADMLEAGLASVTMVQRSKTLVVPSEHYRTAHDRVYNERIPTKVADRLFCTGPAVLGRLMSLKGIQRWTAMEPERYDSLERVGFKLDREGDMPSYLFGRFGGYALDVGTSAKISQGLIKVKSDSVPIRFVEDGLICANGDFLRADVVVFATGFVGNLRLVAAELFGHDLAGQLEDFGGLDEEGEQKGAFKPSGHPSFWYAGGAVGPCRYMSRFVAMQIKAKMLGTPLPVYSETLPRESSMGKKQVNGL